ncbi:MAG: hypothetical protein WKF77_00930 [Planctomycetaceae bacterium]
MALRSCTSPSATRSWLSRLFFRTQSELRDMHRRSRPGKTQTIRGRRQRPSAVEVLEIRALLSSTNIGAVRPDLADSNDLMQYLLDSDPLGNT